MPKFDFSKALTTYSQLRNITQDIKSDREDEDKKKYMQSLQAVISDPNMSYDQKIAEGMALANQSGHPEYGIEATKMFESMRKAKQEAATAYARARDDEKKRTRDALVNAPDGDIGAEAMKDYFGANFRDKNDNPLEVEAELIGRGRGGEMYYQTRYKDKDPIQWTVYGNEVKKMFVPSGKEGLKDPNNALEYERTGHDIMAKVAADVQEARAKYEQALVAKGVDPEQAKKEALKKFKTATPERNKAFQDTMARVYNRLEAKEKKMKLAEKVEESRNITKAEAEAREEVAGPIREATQKAKEEEKRVEAQDPAVEKFANFESKINDFKAFGTGDPTKLAMLMPFIKQDPAASQMASTGKPNDAVKAARLAQWNTLDKMRPEDKATSLEAVTQKAMAMPDFPKDGTKQEQIEFLRQVFINQDFM